MGAQPRLVHQLRPAGEPRVASWLRRVPPSGPAPHGLRALGVLASPRLERQPSTRCSPAPEPGHFALDRHNPLQPKLTHWMAVQAVDPTFPRTCPGAKGCLWPIPDQLIIAR